MHKLDLKFYLTHSTLASHFAAASPTFGVFVESSKQQFDTTSLIWSGLVTSYNGSYIKCISGDNIGVENWINVWSEIIPSTQYRIVTDYPVHKSFIGNIFELSDCLGGFASNHLIQNFEVNQLETLPVEIKSVYYGSYEGIFELNFTSDASGNLTIILTDYYNPSSTTFPVVISSPELTNGNTKKVYLKALDVNNNEAYLELEFTNFYIPNSFTQKEYLKIVKKKSSIFPPVLEGDGLQEKYQCLALKNDSNLLNVENVQIYLNKPSLISGTLKTAILAASTGTQTNIKIEGSSYWPSQLWVRNITKDDIRFFFNHSGEEWTVEQDSSRASLRHTNSKTYPLTAWDIDDALEAYPWIDIGQDPSNDDVSAFHKNDAENNIVNKPDFENPRDIADPNIINFGTIAPQGVRGLWVKFVYPVNLQGDPEINFPFNINADVVDVDSFYTEI